MRVWVTALNMLIMNGQLSRHHKSSILQLWFVSRGYPLFCLHWDCTVTLFLSQKMLFFCTKFCLFWNWFGSRLKKNELSSIHKSFFKNFFKYFFYIPVSSTNALQTHTVLHFSLKQMYETINNNNQYTDKTEQV